MREAVVIGLIVMTLIKDINENINNVGVNKVLAILLGSITIFYVIFSEWTWFIILKPSILASLSYNIQFNMVDLNRYQQLSVCMDAAYDKIDMVIIENSDYINC